MLWVAQIVSPENSIKCLKNTKSKQFLWNIQEHFPIHFMTLIPKPKRGKKERMEERKEEDYRPRPISLKNIDVKIFNRILEDRIQQHLNKIIPHDLRGIYSRDARLAPYLKAIPVLRLLLSSGSQGTPLSSSWDKAGAKQIPVTGKTGHYTLGFCSNKIKCYTTYALGDTWPIPMMPVCLQAGATGGIGTNGKGWLEAPGAIWDSPTSQGQHDPKNRK